MTWGEGGVKNLKKEVTSFENGPFLLRYKRFWNVSLEYKVEHKSFIRIYTGCLRDKSYFFGYSIGSSNIPIKGISPFSYRNGVPNNGSNPNQEVIANDAEGIEAIQSLQRRRRDSTSPSESSMESEDHRRFNVRDFFEYNTVRSEKYYIVKIDEKHESTWLINTSNNQPFWTAVE